MTGKESFFNLKRPDFLKTGENAVSSRDTAAESLIVGEGCQNQGHHVIIVIHQTGSLI